VGFAVVPLIYQTTKTKIMSHKIKLVPSQKILQQNSTHIAVEQNGRIEVFIKGFKCEDLEFERELIYVLPLDHADDLFAMFEMFDETNRINIAEANAEFGK
jgi:hypothetical protein